MEQPAELYLTNDEQANAFIADDPLALLIGLVLHQQIPTEKAFHGPLILRDRLGKELDAAELAATLSDDGFAVHALWEGVDSADQMMERLLAVPGFGEYKARIYVGVLAEHFGVRPNGYETYLPTWPSIVDITSPEDLTDLKARKKAWKESQS